MALPPLKFFRIQQGVGEVNEQPERCAASQPVDKGERIHARLPQAGAAFVAWVVTMTYLLHKNEGGMVGKAPSRRGKDWRGQCQENVNAEGRLN